jgi:hypothetical protein
MLLTNKQEAIKLANEEYQFDFETAQPHTASTPRVSWFRTCNYVPCQQEDFEGLKESKPRMTINEKKLGNEVSDIFNLTGDRRSSLFSQ